MIEMWLSAGRHIRYSNVPFGPEVITVGPYNVAGNLRTRPPRSGGLARRLLAHPTGDGKRRDKSDRQVHPLVRPRSMRPWSFAATLTKTIARQNGITISVVAGLFDTV